LNEVGTIVVMQDITYVKKLEQDRSDFMHALSHDLKSPLTSIVGWAQLIEKAVPLNEKGQRYVDKLLGSAERMLDMINQMLQTVAKGDSVEVDREPCKFDRIVHDAINDVEGSAKSKNIHLVFTEEGEMYPIMADARRIYHMVLNLLDNAVKYSPPDTQVSVKLSCSDDQILLAVRDQGKGIPEKDLPRLFDKYYRGDKAKIQPGVGLGLSVVWAIADAHGGWVSARNVPGEGAEFLVTLPGSLRLTSDLL
ncbi:MAG: sensor histidine kinase, partial [Anaerolineae bacterium]